MAETFTLYKLIVLYMLDRVDFPLTTSQISEFILDEGYTTSFKFFQHFCCQPGENILCHS